MFGDPLSYPSNVDVLLDTRSPLDPPYAPLVVEGKEILSYPLWPGYEPLDETDFEVFMSTLEFRIAKGCRVYIIDPDGTERAALLAWFFLHRSRTWSPENSLEELNRAYQIRSNKPSKWSDTQVPRFTRQLIFGRFFYSGSSWKAFEHKFRSRARGNADKNRARRVVGKVRVGCLVHPDIRTGIRDPMLEGFIPFRLVPTPQQKWHELSASHLGPFDLVFVSMLGSRSVERSYSLQNAFCSLMVFDQHLDADGKLTSDFFLEHALMVGSLKPLKKHPLLLRTTPSRKPRFLYWQGELVPFKEAKLYIYSTMYYHLVKRTFIFKQLEQALNAGTDAFILDYDGVDFRELGMSYETYMDQDEMPWTDAHILYGILAGLLPWLAEDLVQGVFALSENN